MQQEKRIGKYTNTKELWDNFKAFSICIFGIPEEEEKRPEQNKYLK